MGKAVGHIALSWSIYDKDKLTTDIMIERALEYMKLMDIKNTQYIIIQHDDKPHPHIHIIYNRVSDNGKTISDRNPVGGLGNTALALQVELNHCLYRQYELERDNDAIRQLDEELKNKLQNE